MIGDVLGLGGPDTPVPVAVDPHSYRAEVRAVDRPALRVRPPRDHDGIERAIPLLTALHSVETTSRLGIFERNESPAHAFEMRYLDSLVDFQFVPAGPDWTGTVERQLRDAYPEARLEHDRPEVLALDRLAGLGGDDTGAVGEVYVAGARLDLRRYTLFPIKHINIEGFQRDPFGSITSEMVGAARDDRADAHVTVQVVFKPAPRTWTDGSDDGSDKAGHNLNEIAAHLKAPELEKHRRLIFSEYIEVGPGEQEKKAARIVRDQRGEHGWELTLRVFAASPDPEVAARRAEHAAEMFRNYYESATEQTFVPRPLGETEVRPELWDAVARADTDNGIVKSETETAGLVHLPDASINTDEVDWALATGGRSVPPGTPRFDFEAAGVAGPHVDEQERARTMLTGTQPGDPFWYGWGKQRGTEAGVFEDTLATHQFVGGATGEGKTTLLKHFCRQVADRGYGALFYDPKGRDAEDVVGLLPDHREDDLVFIELGGDRDRQVGFNFLEVPVPDAGPADPAYQQALESLVDDAVAMIAQSSTQDSTWGARMDRVARNLIRGMGKVGYDCTLLDLFFALSSEERREAYARMLSEERVEWIVEYAEEHLAHMDDADLEPLVGRLQQWVENDLLREIVSFPESTVSIEDIVRDGKIVVVRDASTSDTAGPLVATALLRRVWVAVREQTMREDRPDPPPFYAILDEFNEIATRQSNITEILSDARAFGLSITAATQDLSAQLGDEIANAIEGQMRTFLSFNPGRSGDAKLIAHQHSSDVDADDLLNLSKYHFYMRTDDARDELTPTYEVRAFRPLDETDLARTDVETQQLIERSLERYGAERRTSDDVKADSPFYQDTPGTAADADTAETACIPATRVLEATWVAQVRAADTRDEDGYAPLSAVTRELRRRLDGDPTDAELSNAVERTLFGSDLADVERRSGKPSVRLTDAGTAELFAQDTGSDQRGGGIDHRHLLQRAHEALTRLGFVVQLPEQDDPGLPDGIADLPIDPMDGKTLDEVEERRDALQEYYAGVWALTEGTPANLEAETSTIKKPGRTLANLRKAVNNDRVCLFAVPDGTAEGEDLAYWAQRAEQIFRDDDGDLTFVAAVVDGERRFYNRKANLTVGEDAVALRPAPEDGGRTPQLEWVETDDGLVCRDRRGEKTVHARLDGVDALDDPPPGAFPAYREIDHETGTRIVWAGGQEFRYGSEKALRTDWRPIRAPFVPEREFDAAPTAHDFAFIAFPDADNPRYDRPQVYEDGSCRPLFPGDEVGDPLSSTPSGDDSIPEPVVETESDEAAFVRAVRDLALEAVAGEPDPDWSDVMIPYADAADRAPRDLSPTQIGQLRAALDLGKKRRPTGTVILDANLGTKLRQLCDEYDVEWSPPGTREGDSESEAG